MKLTELDPTEALRMADCIRPHWTARALQRDVQKYATRSIAPPVSTYLTDEGLREYVELLSAVIDRSTLNRKMKWYEPRIMLDITRAYAHKTHTHSPQ